MVFLDNKSPNIWISHMLFELFTLIDVPFQVAWLCHANKNPELCLPLLFPQISDYHVFHIALILFWRRPSSSYSVACSCFRFSFLLFL
jgi:hypothetical protein